MYHAMCGSSQKVRGGRVLQYLVVSPHYGFNTLRDMKYTSQHCCDKTMDGKMTLYRECCFPNCTKLWWINLLSYVLRGRSPQRPHTGSDPATRWCLFSYTVLNKRKVKFQFVGATLDNLRFRNAFKSIGTFQKFR